MRSINKMPDNIGDFWSVPNLIDKRGNERTFNDYLVHKVTGDIWSNKRGRFLIPSLSKDTGYMQTGVMDDNENAYYCSQHRIVLAAKLGYWVQEKDCHHINTVRYDNRPDNLEPRTRKENMDCDIARQRMSVAKTGSNHPCAKLNESIVQIIKAGALDQDNLRQYAFVVAQRYNVHQGTIMAVLEGKTWDHVVV